MTDLDNLERLLSEASVPAGWELATLAELLRILDAAAGIVATVSEESDARLIVAMREALPSLIAEARDLRANETRLRVALSRVASAVGAHASPTCSVEFLCVVPLEVELVMEKTATDRELRALRREKAALDQVEARETVVAERDAEIKRLNDVIGEMSE